jgi:hypothetical protein
MNSTAWIRTVEHPYANIKKTQATHSHLQKTAISVPPYTTFAVPFYWMLRGNQKELESALPTPLPPDEEPPFPSPWVFSKERQRALCELFFNRLTPGRSLVFFYTKTGHPLEETYSRLVVGVGVIENVSTTLEYQSSIPGNTYPLWDGKFRHSIRPSAAVGFLLPYHDYLANTGDADEDARRRRLLNEIAVVPETVDVMSFSYAGELATADVALSVLTKCLAAVRKIKEHGIAPGPWDEREEWLNQEIGRTWEDRGAFPGTGATLEALGMRLGTSLILELRASGKIQSLDDPWPILNSILREQAPPPQSAYVADIRAVQATWKGLSDERRALLRLLSRVDVSAAQARRWFDPVRRKGASRSTVNDAAILANPYRIVECDIGDADDHAISLATIDRGVLPATNIRAAHPLELPSRVESPLDGRRVRAALVCVLRSKALQGDALLSELDALLALGKLDLAQPCEVPIDWLNGNSAMLEEEIVRHHLILNHETDEAVACVQIKDLSERESRLSKLLGERAIKPLPTTNEPWKDRILDALRENGTIPDLTKERHLSALDEQAQALERITTRKLSVLVGRAGTGKTTVLSGLLQSSKLAKGGVLFLAPERLAAYVRDRGGCYYRYSDDILILIPGGESEGRAAAIFAAEELKKCGPQIQISATKTAIAEFTEAESGLLLVRRIDRPTATGGLEYLGFRFDGSCVYIRESTMSKFHRGIRRAARARALQTVRRYPGKNEGFLMRAFNIGAFEMKFGRVADFERSLAHRRWTFRTYVKRCAEVFGDYKNGFYQQTRHHRAFIRRAANEALQEAMRRNSNREIAIS